MSQIICPNCKHAFEPTDAMRGEIEQQLRSKMLDWQQKKEEEFRQKEAQFTEQSRQNERRFQQQLRQAELHSLQQLEIEKQQWQTTLEQSLRKQLSGDFENRLHLLQQDNADKEEKLKQARQQELEFLRRQQELQNKEQELDLRIEKQLLERSTALRLQIQAEEKERATLQQTQYQLQLQELHDKLEQQKKLAEEMRRKAEQGSMQTQGESQELLLEELLRSAFPFDEIIAVGKGVRGADCIMVVKNKLGQPCGEIVIESKRAKNFGADWVEKLKADMRSRGADVAVLVTQVLPSDLQRFGEKEGVWICTFPEVRALIQVLREGIIKVYTALQSQENKGEKMAMLYSYLTSSEFNEQWSAIREGFLQLRKSIVDERAAMDRLWSRREKQLEKVLLNMAGFKGSIEGISGLDFQIDLLDDNSPKHLPE